MELPAGYNRSRIFLFVYLSLRSLCVASYPEWAVVQQTLLVIILETFKQGTYSTELTDSHKSGQQNPNIALTESNMHSLSWIP